jgi:hypothetical protein
MQFARRLVRNNKTCIRKRLVMAFADPLWFLLALPVAWLLWRWSRIPRAAMLVPVSARIYHRNRVARNTGKTPPLALTG